MPAEADVTILDALRRHIEQGKTAFAAARLLHRTGNTGLVQTTLLYHALDIQREVWVEQGISTTEIIEELVEHGTVTVPYALAGEIKRLADDSGIPTTTTKMVTFKRTE